jgi:hypothetical protein
VRAPVVVQASTSNDGLMSRLPGKVKKVVVVWNRIAGKVALIYGKGGSITSARLSVSGDVMETVRVMGFESVL